MGCQGGLLLNYSSSQIKTYKQVCSSLFLSFPTSHSLYMLSLTNTWLLRMKEKKQKKQVGIFDPRCCLCNKHQRWERSQPGPLEMKNKWKKRRCWLKNDKQHETVTGTVYNLKQYFPSPFKYILLWPLRQLDQRSGIHVSQINRYDLHFLFRSCLHLYCCRGDEDGDWVTGTRLL